MQFSDITNAYAVFFDFDDTLFQWLQGPDTGSAKGLSDWFLGLDLKNGTADGIGCLALHKAMQKLVSDYVRLGLLSQSQYPRIMAKQYWAENFYGITFDTVYGVATQEEKSDALRAYAFAEGVDGSSIWLIEDQVTTRDIVCKAGFNSISPTALLALFEKGGILCRT